MSLFDQLGAGPQSKAQPNPMQEVQTLRADPIHYLRQKGFNIPDGMTDPGQITQHLLRSGQIGNARYQQAVRMLNGMRR